MLRNIGAVVAGLLVGSIFNMSISMLSAKVLFPMPEGTNMQDPVAMNAYIAGLPVAAMLIVMIAHLGQSFLGAWVAARLAASTPMALALALMVGGFSLLGGIMNMMSLSLPTWMMIELPLYLVMAWLGGRLAMRQRT